MKTVRQMNPLIHCMTNLVVTNFTANGLLAIGASPVMAYAKEETADMAAAAEGLLINIGTPSPHIVESMILAGKSANQKGIPVILDPVGAGATPFRTTIIKQILEEVDISIIRGNAGEIAAIVGQVGTVKGVDAKIETDSIELAKEAAKKLGTVIVVTGKVDVVTDGKQVMTVANGHEWLTKVVGTGCLLGGVMSAFAAVNPKGMVSAAVQSLVFYGVAAERAFTKTENEGIGTFQQQFLNELGNLTIEEAEAFKRVRQVH
ncbi:hydroxyethylthiazole kinase [Shouchella patagoniensis]|uniref:hydroxyethylthiazole kinase n=1 Tax=Shouchella patagoniensis TaxID=228576 RepID=UPI000994E817|nr:hydroxyethylthiazole kinase [Shouchella patagoniensis]